MSQNFKHNYSKYLEILKAVQRSRLKAVMIKQWPIDISRQIAIIIWNILSNQERTWCIATFKEFSQKRNLTVGWIRTKERGIKEGSLQVWFGFNK